MRKEMNNWKWSKDYECYVKNESISHPPSAFCLGNKYLFYKSGTDTHNSRLHGSTIDHWNTTYFGVDLKSALWWLKENTVESESLHWIERY